VKQFEHLSQLFSEQLKGYSGHLEQQQPAELYQPCTYILSLGGKRLRPILTLMACELFGENPRKSLEAAMAIELFHNFSLIHDDILDEAPLRRNQPTVHVKWNQNIAILSGDAMLVQSLQVLQNYPPEVASHLSLIMCETAMQVCEGQQMDMNFEKQSSVKIESYLEMIKLKTAVLLGCGLKMGAITAGVDKKQQSLIYQFGVDLGIAFQLLDDVLDAFAVNTEMFGKRPGGDILSNKKTFLLLKAIELANSTQKKEIEEILKLTADKSEEKIKRMLSVYTDLNVKQLCQQLADSYTHSALTSLKNVAAKEDNKNKLQAFALDLLNRQV